MAEVNSNDRLRFENKIEKTESCWVWKAQICPSGYGAFWLKKTTTAHRSSWLLYKGDIPIGMCVCHTCDNRKCVNPDHLFLGTPLDNTRDMIAKNRKHVQKKKICDQDRDKIISLYLSGVPQRNLGKMFGIHQWNICKIIHEKLPIVKMIGENNNKSVLTEKQVLYIREIYIPKKFGCHRIAKMFNISKSTIQRIIKRETWAHI